MHIRNLLHLFVALFIALLSAASWASFPPSSTPDTTNCNPAAYPRDYASDNRVTATWVCGWQGRPAGECGWSYVSSVYGWDGGITTGVYSGACTAPVTNQCPANSSLSNGECSCAPGYVEQGGQCVNPDQRCQDKQGSTTIVNWTVGYTRSPDIDADPNWSLIGPPNVIPADKQACNQGCKVSLGDATMVYQSASPTPTGVYRLSLDMTATYGGSSCTAGDADGPLNPNQPIPPCPGFVGEVNGKLGCYGTAEKPVRDDKPAPKPPAPIDRGNPSAGEKPVAGEGSGNGGSGRTPANGNGGPAGGPAGAAGGTKPDGTTDKPTDDKKEQQNCGAPGQPKCGIDESGTPGNWGEGKWDSKIADYKAKAQQSLDQIKQSGGETFNPFRDFFFAPPLAACEPFVLPNDQGEITRHCEVVEGVRSIMAYVWALAALWICLGWIKKATA